MSAIVALSIPTAAPAAATCSFPGATWKTAPAAAAGFNPAKLADALDWATMHQSYSVLVIRHGCLAGATRLDSITSNLSLDGWSMTKSVTSMLVGRAVTLGLFDIDAPIGRWVPEADPAHARLTPRHLLTMTSGLHHNWLREAPFAGAVGPSEVRDALAERFDHPPGTWWEYAQPPVTLLAYALERAVGQDLQVWAQRTLFSKIGIKAGTWTWDRDRAGNTQGWAHLHMSSANWARLGYLMLHNGNWNGRQLISRDYIRQATTRVDGNHGYGLLFWLNGGDSAVLPNVYGPDGVNGQLWVAAPSDMYGFVGMRNQRIYVVPSLDMVIVRLGDPGEYELDTRNSVWQSQTGMIDYEMVRLIMQSVSDVEIPDPGPYRGDGLGVPPTNAGLVQDATELNDILAGLGVPFWAPDGCTPAGCR